MAVTFCGVPLLLPDPEGRVQAHLDRYLSLDEMRVWCEPAAVRSGRARPRGLIGRDSPFPAVGIDGSRVGLPRPNWSTYFMPRATLSTLWWPTGASRWAQGLFLADDAALTNINAAIGSDGSGTLSLTASMDGASQSVAASMFLLAPIRLTGTDGDDGQNLWLLPLVDQRYFWQRSEAGLLEVEADTTWAEILATLGNQLGTTITADSAPAVYVPDPVELTRRYENAAVLLDAVAACIGQRVVVSLGGSVRLQNTTTAAIYDQLNRTSAVVVAGGDVAGVNWSLSPATVKVIFPRYQLGIPQADGDVYAVSVTGSASGRGTKVFFDTAAAEFGYGGATPYNEADLQAIAEQIATDFVAWQRAPAALTLAGLATWTPSGYDDFVWYHVGSLSGVIGQDGERYGQTDVFTRVAGMPLGFGVEELVHQPPESSSSSSSSTSSISSSTTSSSSISTSSSSSSRDDCTQCVCIDAEDCWLICDGNWLTRRQPGGAPSGTSTNPAQCGVTHYSGLGNLCSIMIDDAGCVLGWNLDGTWESPFNVADPEA